MQKYILTYFIQKFNVTLQVQEKAKKYLDDCLDSLRPRLERMIAYTQNERGFSSNMQTFAHLRCLSHLMPLVTRLEEQEKALWKEIRKLKEGIFEKKWETKSMEKEYTERKSEEKGTRKKKKGRPKKMMSLPVYSKTI